MVGQAGLDDGYRFPIEVEKHEDVNEYHDSQLN
jgi:hypothetical protein